MTLLHPLSERKGAATEASTNLDYEVIASERGRSDESLCDVRL